MCGFPLPNPPRNFNLRPLPLIDSPFLLSKEIAGQVLFWEMQAGTVHSGEY